MVAVVVEIDRKTAGKASLVLFRKRLEGAPSVKGFF
jgi:hypothetical protein